MKSFLKNGLHPSHEGGILFVQKSFGGRLTSEVGIIMVLALGQNLIRFARFGGWRTVSDPGSACPVEGFAFLWHRSHAACH